MVERIVNHVDCVGARAFLQNVVGRGDGNVGIGGHNGKFQHIHFREPVDMILGYGRAAGQGKHAFVVVYALGRDHARLQVLDEQMDHRHSSESSVTQGKNY